MSFTQEHIAVLEKHREHYDTLRKARFMRNLDEPVKRALQLVYNEAVGPQRFTLWCGDCVADMVQQLYRAYEAWAQEPVTDQPITNVQQKETFKNRRQRRALLDKGPQGA